MGTTTIRQSIDRTEEVEVLIQQPFPVSATLETWTNVIQRIHEIDQRIKTWKRIATMEKIDIDDEKNHLHWLRKDKVIASGRLAEEINLLRQEIMRKHLCRRIVKKVRKNFKRDIPEERETGLKEKLYYLNNNLLRPWMRIAREENVDISKETDVIIAATCNGLHALSQKMMQTKLVVLLQQINHVTLCTARIIRKVYIYRIQSCAEEEKSKDWFDDNWVGPIDGIAQDALAQLPTQGDLETFEERCQNVYEVYRSNLKLLNENPYAYYTLADREWLRRSIILRAADLTQLAKGDAYLEEQIEGIKQIALNAICNKEDSEQLKDRVNQAFELIIERIPKR